MKFAITGALGHIGSRLLREIPRAFPDAEVVLIDNLSTQRYCSLFSLPERAHFRFVEADVLDCDLDELLCGADVVVHLAAVTDAAGSFANRERVEHVNFNATRLVAEACLRNGCRLFYPSSTSVYGTQKDVVDENCALDDLKPQSPYAATKLREENLLRALAEQGELRFVVCRLGTVCGVSPGMRFHTAVNKFCWQAMLGQPLTVWRTALHQLRPYLDLTDAARAIVHVAAHGHFDGQVYNVLSANHSVAEILGFVREHIPALHVAYVDTEIMNQLSFHVRNDRFQSLGFRFEGNLKQSVAETIALLKGACTEHGREEALHARGVRGLPPQPGAEHGARHKAA